VKATAAVNQRLAERLRTESRISFEEFHQVVGYATRNNCRVEDALIELDIIPEADLLSYIGKLYGTKFVSTDKLHKAQIDPRIIALVTAKTADLHGVFPLLFDGAKQQLVVATPDPDNDVALKEIKIGAGVKDVQPIVARPAAVRAAIGRAYHRDSASFERLLRAAASMMQIQGDGIELGPVNPRPRQTSPDHGSPRGGLALDNGMPAPEVDRGFSRSHTSAPGAIDAGPRSGLNVEREWAERDRADRERAEREQAERDRAERERADRDRDDRDRAERMERADRDWADRIERERLDRERADRDRAADRERADRDRADRDRDRAAPPGPPPPRRRPESHDVVAKKPVLSLSSSPPPLERSDGGRLAPPPPRMPNAVTEVEPESAPPSMIPPMAVAEVTLSRDYLETVSVLVNIAESSRADLKGHSTIVSRLMERMARRLGQTSSATAAFALAGHLHDIGKQGTFHLTTLNVAEYDGHRVAAQKVLFAIDRLFDKVALSVEARSAVTTMYERFDGKGIPSGLGGKDIPLGGRVLAIVDTYADLTNNGRNPYRRILKPAEACDVMASFKGKVFDPHLVEVFKPLALGDDIRARLLADQPTVLLVDPSVEETEILEQRLLEQGFEVRVARTLQQAFYELQSSEIDVVVSEVDLDQPDGGITLRATAKDQPWGRELVWVVLARRSDREMAQAAFAMGVDDFIAKPAVADVLVAKLVQLVDRAKARLSTRGVSGSLAEMGFPDMVQILWHGRKTCALKIEHEGQKGEVHFQAGQIVHALWADLQGEVAFYKMLALPDGTFRMDPTFEPKQKTISTSPEGLLLEGMRRLDEQSMKGG